MGQNPASGPVSRPVRQARRQRPALDEFDRRILAALVENARATNVEIAQKVGLSEAPCSRRIRRLEVEGVIRGYGARLDPDLIGIGFIAYVTLVLDSIAAATAEEFAREIAAIPEIISCHIVSGGYDAILHVVAADSQAYSDIVFNRLTRIQGVKDVRSSFVMRTIKESAGLPVAEFEEWRGAGIILSNRF